MKTLVVYDTVFGNTGKVAKTIGKALESAGDVKVRRADQVKPIEVRTADLLIVGSPTQGGRPTVKLQSFLDSLASHSLRNIRVAAFDTRFAIKEQGLGLKIVMKTVGFAAPRIAANLEAKEGQRATEPEGFIVSGKEGPLKPGELERAATWAKGLHKS